jgi:uncharacterized protein (TIGR02268 family)
VSLASAAGLLALTLLSNAPDAEQLLLDQCEAASPRIELSAAPSGKVPVVCIDERLSTTLRFDSPIRPESVRLEEQERFADVAVGKKTLALVPPENLTAGKRFEVEVCFADEQAPACAAFLLVAHPGLAMQQVDVFRQQTRSVAYYQQLAEEAQAEARHLRAEVQQLRAERNAPDGLRGALASGLVTQIGGIAVRDLTNHFAQREGNALVPERVHTYRAPGSVAVEMHLANPGTMPWVAAGAVLRGAKGEVLKPLLLWQPEPIVPGGMEGGRVVVEVLATEKEARGTYTLTLWDAERQRTVTLGNVTFS